MTTDAASLPPKPRSDTADQHDRRTDRAYLRGDAPGLEQVQVSRPGDRLGAVGDA